MEKSCEGIVNGWRKCGEIAGQANGSVHLRVIAKRWLGDFHGQMYNYCYAVSNYGRMMSSIRFCGRARWANNLARNNMYGHRLADKRSGNGNGQLYKRLRQLSAI